MEVAKIILESDFSGSLTRLFLSSSQSLLVNMAASAQAPSTLGLPSSPELPEQPEQSLSSTHIIPFFLSSFDGYPVESIKACFYSVLIITRSPSVHPARLS